MKSLCTMAVIALPLIGFSDQGTIPTPPAKKEKPTPVATSAVAAPAKAELVTGSLIPQDRNQVPNAPMTVIDSNMIRNSGCSDVAELLRRRGYNR